LPAEQSLLTVHVVLHAVPEHSYAPQLPPALLHEPAPSHLPVEVYVESDDVLSVQVLAPHVVVTTA
jgi:hypothetical protein